MAYGGNVRRRQLPLRFWSRPARVLGLVALTGLLAPGLAGCEYADLEPLATQTAAPTPDAYVETVEARESRLARDAKFEELRVDVEAQLRQLPSETIGGTLGGLQFDNQMSFSTSITEAGEYAVASTCNPAAATSIHVVQGSTSWTTAVPCGDLAETVVPVEPGQVRISLQSLDSEFFVGAIFLVKAEP